MTVPTARNSYSPLDLDTTRTAVESGRTVRVGILPTHHFPDGAAGRIISIGRPEADGPEFILVELTVGGAKDVVPFAPADLSPIKRGQSAPEPIAQARRPRLPRAVRPAKPAPAAPAVAAPTAVRPPESATPRLPTTSQTPLTAPATPATPAAPAARKPARGKRQPVTVTLSTTEPDHTGWQVEVKVGARAVVKPSPVHPAQAWALVTDLGHPEVARVVAGALNEHRAQAQERADRLARELAAAQADLATYPTF